MPEQPDLLNVENLTLRVGGNGPMVVRNFHLTIAPGEIVGIVGESGSGKTLAARSIMRLEPPSIQRVSGSLQFDGSDITSLTSKELRNLRGNRVGMVFQEPMTSLNPAMLLGRQLEEGLKLHRNLEAAERRRLILEMLTRIGMREPEAALTAYPHQFSGGMRQRIMLASVMLLEPALLIADEPTTALDAVVQRDVLELMMALTRERGTAVLMISHDLSMVAQYTNRVIVMCKGEIVEDGETRKLLQAPTHDYTRKLLSAMPRRVPARVLGASKRPIIEVRDLVVNYPGRQGIFRRESGKRALHGVSLTVDPGEVVAVVGGSGSGKTTLGRAIAGLIKPGSGDIRYEGHLIEPGTVGWQAYRFNCQMVFQDPASSLDPRLTVGRLIKEALRGVPDMTQTEKNLRLAEVLAEVGLDEAYSCRYPHELSGGQRQRVAIARAVVRRPKFVIADEPVSALDVTVRAQVLDMFADLQARHGFSCLFISHDLAVVEQVADRVVVMNEGRIVEEGDRDSIFDSPQNNYTRRLLSAVPRLETNPEGGVRLKWHQNLQHIQQPRSRRNERDRAFN